MDKENLEYGQPIGSLVLTPTGFKKIEDLNIGDEVCTSNGKSSKIKNKSNIFQAEVCQVEFSDDTHVKCCKDQLFITKDINDRACKRDFKLRSLNQIKLDYIKKTKRNYNIKLTKPLELSNNKLAIPPYTFGALIGDGTMIYYLGFSTEDEYIINKIQNELDCSIKQSTSNTMDYIIKLKDKMLTKSHQIIASIDNEIIKVYDSFIDAKSDGYSESLYQSIHHGIKHKGINWSYGEIDYNCPFRSYLVSSGLFGKRSEEKFIPNDYLFASLNDRIAVVQGLMDTDGTIDSGGITSEYSTSSQQLSKDFMFMVQSLGGTCTVSSRIPTYTHKGKKLKGLLNYRLWGKFQNDIKPFQLPRKLNLVKERTKYFPIRFIDNVQYIGVEDCINIQVEGGEYLTNDCIVLKDATSL